MRSQARHRLKQDQFSAAAQEAVHWTVEHRNTLTYGGIALAIVAALALGGWWYMQHQDDAAGEALGHAISIYQAPITPGAAAPAGQTTTFNSSAERAKAAKAEFQKIAGEFGHTRSGEIAKYMVGLTDVDLGNNADAEKELKAVADGGKPDIASMAKLALASLYRRTGRDQDAVNLYKQLIDKPTNTVGKSSAQLELAATYEAKNPQDARVIYQQIQKEDPKGAAAEVAAQKLASIK